MRHASQVSSAVLRPATSARRHPTRRPAFGVDRLEPRVFLSADDCGCSTRESDFTVVRDPSAAPTAPYTVDATVAAPAEFAPGVSAQAVVTPQASSPDSSNTTPAAWAWYHGVDSAFVAARADAGWRLVDIEVESADPNRYTVAFVANTGAHAKSWWYYYGLTPAQITDYVDANNARLVDIESYGTSAGTRYAVIMIRNTGADAEGWWWYYNITSTQIMDLKNANNARLVDIEEHSGAAIRTFDVIMNSNAGADAVPTFYYFAQTPEQIGSLIDSQNARLVDIEPVANGRFDVILERTPVSAWWWYYGMTEQDVNEKASQNGARVFHVAPYFVSNQKRFAAIMVNNSNEVETRVGEILRDASSTAESGLYLKRVGGPVLAGLQENHQFEPASMIKALLHLTAMRAVQNNTAELSDPLWMYYSGLNPYSSFNSPGNPDECPDGYSETTTNRVSLTLQQQLEMMMERSDNRATETIEDRFGRPAVNATAALANMANTEFASRIGCGIPGNFLTLADAGRMYEGVVNNTLLTAANASTYFRLMIDQNNVDKELVPFNEGVFGPFQAVAREEAADLLNRPQSDPLVDELADAFIAEMRGSWKGGGYTIPGGGTNWNEIRTAGGYVGLPFRNSPGVTTVVDYVYGVYIEGALNPQANPTPGRDAVAAAWSDGQAELLRNEIRAALATWRVNPRVSVGNATVTEGDSGVVTATFTLSLTGGGSDLPARVSYATAPGTAAATLDYTGETGVVNFAPGDDSQTVTISVRGDTLDENSETFTVALSNPVNLIVQDGTGTGTVLDDDDPPTVSVRDFRGLEGDVGTSAFGFVVSLSAASSKTVTVTATTAGGTASGASDYTHAAAQVTFLPGETSKTFTVQVTGDTAVEPDEQFSVVLSNAGNATIGDGTGTGTILNDDNLVVLARVTQVYVSGTAWGAAFKNYLQSPLASGHSVYGFAVPGGAAQLDELPWANANEISIQFNVGVAVQADDLVVRGVNVATYPTDPAVFAYDAATRTATWRLPAGMFFGTDKLLLDLNADAPTGVTAALGGARLDGNWSNAADAYPSGDGAEGGDFRFRLNMLPGDVNRSGSVLANDYAEVKNRFFKNTASPTGTGADYTPFHDTDGNGSILANDYSEVKKRFFQSLPPGEPAAPAAAAAVSFGGSLIRPAARSRLAADLLA